MAYELTQEDRSRGGRRSGESRVLKALTQRKAAQVMWEVLDRVPAEELPEYFTSGAVGLVELVRCGELMPPESATDVLKYVEAADKLHKMGRLAAGQSTSNSAHLDVANAAELLRARAAQLDTPPT